MPFICPKCQHVFSAKEKLDKHLNRRVPCVNEELDDNSIRCKFCNNKFATQSSLNRHLNTCVVRKTPDLLIKQLEHKDEIIQQKDEIIEQKDELLKQFKDIKPAQKIENNINKSTNTTLNDNSTTVNNNISIFTYLQFLNNLMLSVLVIWSSLCQNIWKIIRQIL